MTLKIKAKKLNLVYRAFILNKMKVVVVHGISEDEGDNPRGHWMPWLKEKLKKKSIECFIPLMPEPWNPKYEEWKKKFGNLKINEEDILVGHSGGCAFLVRWLGETKKKIKKLILVAPWKIPSKDFSEGENELYDFKIDEGLKEKIDEIIVFTSDDEEEGGKKSVEIYSRNLDSKLVKLENFGHFTLGDMGTEEFPRLLEEFFK